MKNIIKNFQPQFEYMQQLVEKRHCEFAFFTQVPKFYWGKVSKKFDNGNVYCYTRNYNDQHNFVSQIQQEKLPRLDFYQRISFSLMRTLLREYSEYELVASEIDAPTNYADEWGNICHANGEKLHGVCSTLSYKLSIDENNKIINIECDPSYFNKNLFHK